MSILCSHLQEPSVNYYGFCLHTQCLCCPVMIVNTFENVILYPYILRFSASFSYYGLSLGAGSLSDNLYVSSSLMGLVELPGYVICVLMIERSVVYSTGLL